MQTPEILVAGATGNLGGEIIRALVARKTAVRALVRKGTAPQRLAPLQALGVAIVEADLLSVDELSRACSGVTCVVSALAGLHDVIITAQGRLLEGAVAAKVPRFIPSDYAMDFAKLTPGSNRNLDIRRIFRDQLDRAPIAATSILNGAFTDMLTGQAPLILFKWKRILYWGSAEQTMDFTTVRDTANYTAAAALDAATPRWLRIAGDQLNVRELAAIVTEVAGEPFKLLRPGGLHRLQALTAVMRALTPKSDALYPPWQGMQYFYGMFSGQGKLEPLDNERYPGIRWTKVRDVLAAHLGVQQ